ncbi:MAG: polysaccharide deacetylase family protein, partial [Christensenellaceae bacterium]
MKSFKKIITVFVAAMLLFSLAGCSGSKQPEAEASEQPTVLSSTAQPSEDATEAISEPVIVVPSQEPEVSDDAPQETTPNATDAQTSFSQLHLGDNFIPPKSIDGIDPLNDKVVALTFDDGPHPEYTGQLLDILKANGVVATFFLVGENAERYPDIIKRIYDEGHEIGTHSYDHPDLRKLSLDQILSDQYGKTNDAIEAAIGLRATIDRPPYGGMNTELAEQIGREQVMWDVDPEDWKDEYKNSESLFNNVIHGANTGIGVRDGSVVLSHDIHKTTVEAYDSIIKELKNQGYTFVTITQMMQIAEARGKDVGYIFNGAPSAAQAQ